MADTPEKFFRELCDEFDRLFPHIKNQLPKEWLELEASMRNAPERPPHDFKFTEQAEKEKGSKKNDA